jgi:putative transposase
MTRIAPWLTQGIQYDYKSPYSRKSPLTGDKIPAINKNPAPENGIQKESLISAIKTNIRELMETQESDTLAEHSCATIFQHTIKSLIETQKKRLIYSARGDINNLLSRDELLSQIRDSFQPANRNLKAHYPVAFFKSFKIQTTGYMEDKTSFLLVGVGIDFFGVKNLLGALISDDDTMESWGHFIHQIKNSGVKDIIIARCAKTGSPGSIESNFPETIVQLDLGSVLEPAQALTDNEDTEEIISNLQDFYFSENEKIAMSRLERFSERWDTKYPILSALLEDDWPYLSNQFQLPRNILEFVAYSKVISSLDESLRRTLRRYRGIGNHRSALDAILDEILEIAASWTTPIRNWKSVRNKLHRMYPERMASCVSEASGVNVELNKPA